MNRKFFVSLAIVVTIFGAGESLFAQKRKKPPNTKRISAPAPAGISAQKSASQRLNAEQKRRLEAFNQVWQTLDRYYYDKTFSGLNWNEIKKEFEPRVLRTTTDAQLHNLLQEMINRLNRSHFAIIPPEVYTTIERAKSELKAKEKKLGERTAVGNAAGDDESFADEEEFKIEDFLPSRFGLGVDLRLIDEKIVITRVEKDSAGELAGLQTGYIIEKINGVALDEMFQRLAIYYSNVRNYRKHLPLQIVNWFLNGEEDTYVNLTVRDENEQLKELKIRRERLKGETILIGKNYPEQHLRFETEAVNQDVGYIRFNLFAIPVIEKFCDALTKLKDKKAIIVDLRGNTGGVIGTLVGLSGMLTEKQIDLGTSIYNVGSERLLAGTKAKNYKGKLVFLVDSQTVSAAEVFAAAVQENDRAIVIGERTAGEVLPAVSVELATGAYLIYPIANYKTVRGNFLEGAGVAPDITVALDRKTLLSGKDNQLEAALQFIRENKELPKRVPKDAAKNADSAVFGGPPPPPPPVAAPTPKPVADAALKMPPPPPPAPIVKPAEAKDEKAWQVINDAVAAIGGEAEWRKLNSYILKGTATISVRGSKSELGYTSYRVKPEKYAEILTSDTIGEVREIYNGKTLLVQTDFGAVTEIPFEQRTERVDPFLPFYGLLNKNSFKSLKYQGAFDRQGRKAHVIEAVSIEGTTLALAFDVETKFLVSYNGTYFGFSFGDYRKVGNLMIPFTIEREGLMQIRLDEAKINQMIDEAVFTKKENCFDRAN